MCSAVYCRREYNISKCRTIIALYCCDYYLVYQRAGICAGFLSVQTTYTRKHWVSKSRAVCIIRSLHMKYICIKRLPKQRKPPSEFNFRVTRQSSSIFSTRVLRPSAVDVSAHWCVKWQRAARIWWLGASLDITGGCITYSIKRPYLRQWW